MWASLVSQIVVFWVTLGLHSPNYHSLVWKLSEIYMKNLPNKSFGYPPIQNTSQLPGTENIIQFSIRIEHQISISGFENQTPTDVVRVNFSHAALLFLKFQSFWYLSLLLKASCSISAKRSCGTFSRSTIYFCFLSEKPKRRNRNVCVSITWRS